MKTEFKKSFLKDLRRHRKNKSLLSRIKEVIEEVEAAETHTNISNLKKLKPGGTYYRIRIGNYRIGLIIADEVASFVRALDRKEMYRYFP